MAGRRLLDFVRVLHASRDIAKQHLALRSQQLGVFNQTSSLARAVKSQTDRVTLTAQAAIALSQHFNESQAQANTVYSRQDGTIPTSESVREASEKRPASEEGLQQDHHYEPSRENATRDGRPEGELEVTQKKAPTNPLPDGTIPPKKSPIAEQTDSSTLSQATIYGRAETGTSFASQVKQRASEVLQPLESNHSSIQLPASVQYSSKDARDLQWQSEKHIPAVTVEDAQVGTAEKGLNAGHDADVYYEPGKQTNTTHSSLPRTKIPKHTETSVEEPASIGEAGINSDVYPVGQSQQHPTKSQERATQELNENPNGFTSEKEMENLADALAGDAKRLNSEAEPALDKPRYEMRESRVPSSRFGRLWQYAGLGTSMAFGAVGEGLRRVTGGAGSGGSLMLSPANMERLVAKLSRMRGAALKLGQMVSFQDMKMLPAPIHEVLQRVQDSADYMPASQRNQVLSKDLGSDWRNLFESFNEKPMAAASIGQVHKAVLRSNGQEVAVKVQYPGVAKSIDSDLNNLSVLLTASRLLPKGLYLDKTIANARTELAWECDYIREANCAIRFQKLLANETKTFTVPTIFQEACGEHVLTAELMHGTAVTKLPDLSQKERDWIGSQILRLCLKEISEFKFMQTDPNWTNFLYNQQTQKIELLDFGASREYPDEFVEPYLGILEAASRGDRDAVADLSVKLGYLTGHESSNMRNAHIDSVLTLAEPFTQSAPEVYDFRDQTITDRVRSLIPLMVKERLAPPPEETYSLHRKLSGAFLLCAKLGSRVACRQMFADAMSKWHANKA